MDINQIIKFLKNANAPYELIEYIKMIHNNYIKKRRK